MIHHSSSGEFAIRMGNWKLIVNERVGRKTGRRVPAERKYELYDLHSDPAETRNLAGKETERVRAMAETLERIKRQAGSVRRTGATRQD